MAIAGTILMLVGLNGTDAVDVFNPVNSKQGGNIFSTDDIAQILVGGFLFLPAVLSIAALMLAAAFTDRRPTEPTP